MKIKILIVLCMFSVLLFSMCSTEKNPLEAGSQAIKAAKGGSIVLENGISLFVPPDALEKDTEIEMTALEANSIDQFTIVGATLKPHGLVFLKPVILQFPLSDDWPENEQPAIYEIAGSELSDFLLSGLSAIVRGVGDKLVATIEIYHFSSLGLARNCHAGTISYLVDDLQSKGCALDELTSKVSDQHPGRYSTSPYKGRPDEIFIDNVSMQSFLDSYFSNARGYEEWDDVPQSFLDKLSGDMILDNKQIVVAFNTIWSDANSDGYYDGFAHSASLEIVNGQLKLRQSASVNDKLYEQLIEKNGENVYYYPKEGPLTAELLNTYRKAKSGVGFENELCGQPGCLWPNNPVEERSTPYKAIRFYISNYSNTNLPCDDECLLFSNFSSPEERLFDERFAN